MNLAAIHIRKKEAGLNTAQYRELLQNVAGVTSAKDLTEKQYKDVMAAMFRIIRAKNGDAQRMVLKSPTEAKIWALWYELKPYLQEQEQTVAYLCGIIGKVIGYKIKNPGQIKRLSDREHYKIIEGLKLRLKQEEFLFSQNNEIPF